MYPLLAKSQPLSALRFRASDNCSQGKKSHPELDEYMNINAKECRRFYFKVFKNEAKQQDQNAFLGL
jgi:hypothetical protein